MKLHPFSETGCQLLLYSASEVFSNLNWKFLSSKARHCTFLVLASSVCKDGFESGHGGKELGPLGAIVLTLDGLFPGLL